MVDEKQTPHFCLLENLVHKTLPNLQTPPCRSSEPETHVLIIGGGITGLTLAQALRKRNQENPNLKPVTFSVFERDPDPYARGSGWGLTMHWALEQFLQLLPEDTKAKLPNAWVDKDSLEAGISGSFKLFNLETGNTDYFTPLGASPRNRFAREKLREALMHELDIQVSLYAML